MKKSIISRAVSIALALSISSVYAADEADSEEDDGNVVLITTGTSKGRLAADTPLSVTTISGVELSKISFSSQADVMRAIPAIKAEGGGGEVASNVFVRGLPSGGQFQYTPLSYDGSPTLSIFGLNSSAFDVFYRNDLGIERLEFVRGGVSNLFGAGSVAGVINYISKKGSDFPSHSVQLEYAEEGRIKTDFAFSGPLSDKGLYYAMSGFYRYDEGPIDTGIPTEGYQLRGNIHKEFEDQSGSFTVYTQIIDDKVQFFLPLPLDGENQERLSGNDGQDVESLNTINAGSVSFPTRNGRYESPIENGVLTRGASFSVEFDKELSDTIVISGRAKFSSYEHEFNLFLDGDGQINLPETPTDFLNNRGLGSLANANFTYTGSGAAVGANDLLFANRVLDRNRPTEDFSSEFNLTKTFDVGSFTHDVTVGTFFSNSSADDDIVLFTYLGEFNNQPRLVDLTITDIDGTLFNVAPGTEVNYSNNGLTKAGNGFSNNTRSAQKKAIYIADQFENEDWIFDMGLRIESIDGQIKLEGTESVVVNADPSLAPDLQSNVQGTGNFTRGNVSTTDVAVSLAALYRYSDSMNIYANFSRGYFFPQIRSVRFNNGSPASYKAETIKQFELGLKYFEGDFTGSAALFYAGLTDRRSITFVNDNSGGIREQVDVVDTESIGFELVGKYQLSDEFSIDSNISYDDHEFTKFEGSPNNVGNRFRRKPTFMLSNALRYDSGSFDASLYHTHNGKNFANDSNTIRLDSFDLFNFDMGYSWDMGSESKIRTSVSVFNLTDSQGITEGSPRQGTGQTAGDFFVGRPILPRRVSFRIRYDF